MAWLVLYSLSSQVPVPLPPPLPLPRLLENSHSPQILYPPIMEPLLQHFLLDLDLQWFLSTLPDQRFGLVQPPSLFPHSTLEALKPCHFQFTYRHSAKKKF